MQIQVLGSIFRTSISNSHNHLCSKIGIDGVKGLVCEILPAEGPVLQQPLPLLLLCRIPFCIMMTIIWHLQFGRTFWAQFLTECLGQNIPKLKSNRVHIGPYRGYPSRSCPTFCMELSASVIGKEINGRNYLTFNGVECFN